MVNQLMGRRHWGGGDRFGRGLFRFVKQPAREIKSQSDIEKLIENLQLNENFANLQRHVIRPPITSFQLSYDKAIMEERMLKPNLRQN